VTADCSFCRIVAREVPARVVHETDSMLAFHDIDPKAPTHVLVIPKEHHTSIGELAEADPGLAGDLLATAHEVAEELRRGRNRLPTGVQHRPRRRPDRVPRALPRAGRPPDDLAAGLAGDSGRTASLIVPVTTRPDHVKTRRVRRNSGV
jgi:hypothetical protein